MGHPGILLGRIAARSDLQRSSSRVGSLLLEHAIHKACEASRMIGGRFVVLDAKTDELRDWYARMGFLPLKDAPRRMVLPMRIAAESISRLGEGHFRF